MDNYNYNSSVYGVADRIILAPLQAHDVQISPFKNQSCHTCSKPSNRKKVTERIKILLMVFSCIPMLRMFLLFFSIIFGTLWFTVCMIGYRRSCNGDSVGSIGCVRKFLLMIPQFHARLAMWALGYTWISESYPLSTSETSKQQRKLKQSTASTDSIKNTHPYLYGDKNKSKNDIVNKRDSSSPPPVIVMNRVSYIDFMYIFCKISPLPYIAVSAEDISALRRSSLIMGGVLLYFFEHLIIVLPTSTSSSSLASAASSVTSTNTTDSIVMSAYQPQWVYDNLWTKDIESSVDINVINSRSMGLSDSINTNNTIATSTTDTPDTNNEDGSGGDYNNNANAVPSNNNNNTNKDSPSSSFKLLLPSGNKTSAHERGGTSNASRPIVMFPEGIMKQYKTLLAFQDDAFISMQPVQPVVFKYNGQQRIQPLRSPFESQSNSNISRTIHAAKLVDTLSTEHTTTLDNKLNAQTPHPVVSEGVDPSWTIDITKSSDILWLIFLQTCQLYSVLEVQYLPIIDPYSEKTREYAEQHGLLPSSSFSPNTFVSISSPASSIAPVSTSNKATIRTTVTMTGASNYHSSLSPLMLPQSSLCMVQQQHPPLAPTELESDTSRRNYSMVSELQMTPAIFKEVVTLQFLDAGNFQRSNLTSADARFLKQHFMGNNNSNDDNSIDYVCQELLLNSTYSIPMYCALSGMTQLKLASYFIRFRHAASYSISTGTNQKYKQKYSNSGRSSSGRINVTQFKQCFIDNDVLFHFIASYSQRQRHRRWHQRQQLLLDQTHNNNSHAHNHKRIKLFRHDLPHTSSNPTSDATISGSWNTNKQLTKACTSTKNKFPRSAKPDSYFTADKYHHQSLQRNSGDGNRMDNTYSDFITCYDLIHLCHVLKTAYSAISVTDVDPPKTSSASIAGGKPISAVTLVPKEVATPSDSYGSSDTPASVAAVVRFLLMNGCNNNVNCSNGNNVNDNNNDDDNDNDDDDNFNDYRSSMYAPSSMHSQGGSSGSRPEVSLKSCLELLSTTNHCSGECHKSTYDAFIHILSNGMNNINAAMLLNSFLSLPSATSSPSSLNQNQMRLTQELKLSKSTPKSIKLHLHHPRPAVPFLSSNDSWNIYNGTSINQCDNNKDTNNNYNNIV